MSTWQTRLVEERDDLEKRGDKLFDFVSEEGGVYDTLDRGMQMQLMAQLAYMSAYFEALEDRVDQLDNLDEAEDLDEAGLEELFNSLENSKSKNRDSTE